MSSDSAAPTKPAPPLPQAQRRTPVSPLPTAFACCRSMQSRRPKADTRGMPMGMADIATVLFSEFLKFDPATPDWMDRDRFVISNGHGSMLLYALFESDRLRRHDDGSAGKVSPGGQQNARPPGVQACTLASRPTTGPLGQGIATSVGMALGEHILGGPVR